MSADQRKKTREKTSGIQREREKERLTVGRDEHVVEVMSGQEAQSTEDKGVEETEEGVREDGIGERQREDNEPTGVDQINGDKQEQVVL